MLKEPNFRSVGCCAERLSCIGAAGNYVIYTSLDSSSLSAPVPVAVPFHWVLAEMLRARWTPGARSMLGG